VVGREVAHHLVFDRDQVAANRAIVRAKLNALSGGFERRPPRKVLMRVIAQQAQVSHVRSGWQIGRHMVCAADDAGGCDGIHGGDGGGLERRFAGQRLLRLVGTAIGND